MARPSTAKTVDDFVNGIKGKKDNNAEVLLRIAKLKIEIQDTIYEANLRGYLSPMYSVAETWYKLCPAVLQHPSYIYQTTRPCQYQTHLKAHPFALKDALAEQYPPHARVVHASSATTCTQAYAVSQQGARKLLWQFGLQTLTNGWDFMLKAY